MNDARAGRLRGAWRRPVRQPGPAAPREAADRPFLADVAIHLAACGSPDAVYDVVRDSIPALFPDTIAVVGRVTEDGDRVEVRDVLGVSDSLLGRALDMFGSDPRGHRFRLAGPLRAVYTHAGLHRFAGGLVEMAAGQVPRPLLRSVEKLLSIREVWTLALGEAGHLFGYIQVLVTRPGVIFDRSVVEPFAHLCYLAFARLASEERLRESERSLAAMLNANLESAFLLDRNGLVVLANPRAAERLGIPLESLVGRCVFDLLPPDVGDARRERLERVFATGQPVRFEDTRADMAMEHHVYPVVDEHGRVASAAIFAIDITERKRAEHALRESEGRVRAKLDAILLPEGDIGSLELADLLDVPEIQALMDRFLALTGIGVAIVDLRGTILVGTGWQDICTRFHRVHPDTARHCHASDTRLSAGVEPGTFRTYRCENGMWDIATPIVAGGRHVGSVFFGQLLFDDEEPDHEAFRERARVYGFEEEAYLAALERVPHWSRERVDAIMSFYAKLADLISTLGFRNFRLARTVSERDALLTSLHESEEKYRTLFESIDDAVYVIDRQSGRIIDVNPAAQRMYGYTRDEFVGLKNTDMSAEPEETDQATAERQLEIPLRLHRRKDGTVFPLEFAAGTCELQGRPTIIGTARDISERHRAEQALRESENRYRSILEYGGIGLGYWTTDGRALFFNRRAAEHMGGAPEQFVGRSLAEIYGQEAAAEYSRRLARAAASDVAVEYEDRVLIATDERWFLSTYARVCDSAGEVAGVQIISHEITARKLVEQALRESEEKHRILLDESVDPFFSFARDGTYRYVNRAFAEGVQRKPQEIIGRNISDVFSREEAERRLVPLAGVFRTGEERVIEVRVPRDDGDRYFITTITPVKDDSGTVSSVVCSSKDITARKRTEEALRESEDMHRTLLDASPVGVLVMQDGLWVYANPEGLAIIGYPDVETLAGTPVIDTIHPDLRGIVRERLSRIADGVSNPPIEMTFLRYDGSSVQTESTSVAITYRGRPAGLLISRDLTIEKRAEQERLDLERRLLHSQKLESLGVLAGGIAHDFNNLLAAILGNLDVTLHDLPLGSPARDTLDEAMKASRRAMDLTRQMLAYSGKGRFVVRPLDLADMLRENAHMFRASVARTVTMNLSLEEVPRILADSGQMQQVVMNLITNASEAIGDSVGVISLATGVQDCDDVCLARTRLDVAPPAGRYVFLEVADTGCGMDAETQRRLFDPFFTTKFTGRGLGMSAVLGIVRGHGGAILVDSEPGLGTTVRVLFPVEQPADTATRQAPGATGSAAADSTRSRLSGTVLVVDDEPSIRDMCRRMLERLGCTVLVARDGEDALSVFREHIETIGCVILDLTMPRMDGQAAFRAIRKLRSDAAIVLTSGYGEESAQERFAGEGPAAFLQKPYSLDRLRETIEPLLTARPHPVDGA
jgi:PAS domain S-box-containing protein